MGLKHTANNPVYPMPLPWTVSDEADIDIEDELWDDNIYMGGRLADAVDRYVDLQDHDDINEEQLADTMLAAEEAEDAMNTFDEMHDDELYNQLLSSSSDNDMMESLDNTDWDNPEYDTVREFDLENNSYPYFHSGSEINNSFPHEPETPTLSPSSLVITDDRQSSRLNDNMIRAILNHHLLERDYRDSIDTGSSEGGWDDPVVGTLVSDMATDFLSESPNLTESSRSQPSQSKYDIPYVQQYTNITTHSPTSKKEKMHEYLMVTTGKDVVLMNTTIPTMSKIRGERDVISKVDIRTDRLLETLDRINMVEWIPELELFVIASQKGTVALMRILQLDLEGFQTCVFNIESFLPTNVLQSSPLYGKSRRCYSSLCINPVYRNDNEKSERR
ncbi:hypothetical protein BDB01DRAFT_15029 [Pilobolus umbonatus]|nr:hypothetical protein BDB01DRAFT_15029 [Pilobolus umbonatus]